MVGCASVLATLALASNSFGATYQVGAGKTYANLGAVANLLAPGDVVEVDGDQTYPGGVAFWNAGTATQKITIRGIRINGKRPVLTGGNNTIEAAGNHYIFESLDLTAGVSRCFYHHADDIVLRDSVVHDCPKQGVLGADSDSGSLLMEYTEVHHCGSGTQNHQIYMATDETTYPKSVFRMQHCYVHDAVGGNGVKTRAERNEIYYNWVEGSLYHELEMIGPDGQDPNLAREDSDVVGNVLFKRNTFSVTRCGGDGTGETNGRYRFVNNTIVVLPAGGAVFRLFDGIESIQMHNNVFMVQGSGTVNLVRQVEAVWTTGSAIFAGSHNWVINGSTNVPAEWTATITGADPGFNDLPNSNVRLLSTSALIDQGGMTLADPPGHAFPSPLDLPQWHPPMHAVEASATAEARPVVSTIDIGAYEYGTGSGGAGGSGGAAGAGGSAGAGGVGGDGGSAGVGGTGTGGTAGAGGTGEGGTSGAGGTSAGGSSGAGGTSTGGSSGAGGTSTGGTAGGAGKAGTGGALADAGPKLDAGQDGAVGADASTGQPATGDDSGCGCRTSPTDASSGAFAFAIAGLALASRRRRKNDS